MILWELEVAFKASPSSRHQHCTDEVQKAETVSALVTFSLSFFSDQDVHPRPVSEEYGAPLSAQCLSEDRRR